MQPERVINTKIECGVCLARRHERSALFSGLPNRPKPTGEGCVTTLHASESRACWAVACRTPNPVTPDFNSNVCQITHHEGKLLSVSVKAASLRNHNLVYTWYHLRAFGHSH